MRSDHQIISENMAENEVDGNIIQDGLVKNGLQFEEWNHVNVNVSADADQKK